MTYGPCPLLSEHNILYIRLAHALSHFLKNPLLVETRQLVEPCGALNLNIQHPRTHPACLGVPRDLLTDHLAPGPRHRIVSRPLGKRRSLQ